jgi:branched-chain amino acid transport system substrate-binding protein
VISLSGRDSVFGKESIDGMRLAIDEVNLEGGIDGRLLRLEVYDDRSDPILAAEGVRVLMRDYHPAAVVGSNTSMVTSAAAVAAQAVEVPLVVPEATNPAITSIGDYIFRVCFVDPDMANALATFAHNQLKLNRVAILMEEKHDYTLSLARHFRRRFQELGGEVVLQMGYMAGETKFADPLKMVREKKADAILVSGFYAEAAEIISEAKRSKMNVTFLGGDAWEADEFFAMAGDALTKDSHVYVASHFSPDLQRIKVRGFVAAFEERYKRRPNTSSALGYDACAVTIGALNDAADLSPASVKQALEHTHYEGVTGRIDIDANRSAMKPVIIMRAMPDRHFAYVQSVQHEDIAPTKTSEESVQP